MKLIKKRIVVAVTLLMMLLATIVPAAAEDSGVTPPSPSEGVYTLTIRVGGLTANLSLPIRCGNNC